jgi:hypothetical protein
MKHNKFLNQKFLSITAFLSINLVCFPELLLANSASTSCPPIATITKKLKKQSPSALLNIEKPQASQYWRNAPKGLLMDISTVKASVPSESEFGYSKQIINQCSGVIAVRFSTYGSDAGNVYGLVKGRVKRFECPKGMQAGDRPFKWGSECLS